MKIENAKSKMQISKFFVLALSGGVVGGALATLVVVRFLVGERGSVPVLPVVQKVEARKDTALDLEKIKETVVYFVRAEDKAAWATTGSTQAVGFRLSSDGLVATPGKLSTPKTLLMVEFDHGYYGIAGGSQKLGPWQIVRPDVEFDSAPNFKVTPFVKLEALMAGDTLVVIAPDGALQITRLLKVLGSNKTKDHTESSEGVAHFLELEKSAAKGSLVFTGQGALAAVADESGNVVPTEFLMPLVRQFLKQEKLAKTYLGVAGVELNGVVPIAFGIPKYGFLMKDGKAGLAIAQGSPAAKAGLKAGDIILSLEGERIGTPYPLQLLLTRYAPGVEVELSVSRENPDTKSRQEMKVKVVLGSR